MALRKLFITIVLLCAFTIPASANPPVLEDVTILVSSCDKYSKLWGIFFQMLFKNWPSLKTYNSSTPIVLVSNTMTYSDPRITNILSPAELKWTGNVGHALAQVKTKYVLYLQDDYFITNPVLEDKIVDVINTMNRVHLEHVGLYQNYFEKHKAKLLPVEGSSLLRYKDHSMPYLASLHTAVWDTKTFKELVDKKESDIWDFEDKRLQPGQKFAFYASNPKPIQYLNFMSVGAVRFNPYAWMYYKGYDLSFAGQYRLGGKRGEYFVWLKARAPRVAGAVLYSWGFCIDLSMSGKSFIKPILDKFSN